VKTANVTKDIKKDFSITQNLSEKFSFYLVPSYKKKRLSQNFETASTCGS
jgi:hypothetical protein